MLLTECVLPPKFRWKPTPQRAGIRRGRLWLMIRFEGMEGGALMVGLKTLEVETPKGSLPLPLPSPPFLPPELGEINVCGLSAPTSPSLLYFSNHRLRNSRECMISAKAGGQVQH